MQKDSKTDDQQYLMAMNEDNRRNFPRVKAPIYCSPVRYIRTNTRPCLSVNISLGGIRVYSDELLTVGKQLDIELFLSDGTSLINMVQVCWLKKLPDDAPARYDVGLQFLNLSEENRARLQDVLDVESGDEAD